MQVLCKIDALCQYMLHAVHLKMLFGVSENWASLGETGPWLVFVVVATTVSPINTKESKRQSKDLQLSPAINSFGFPGGSVSLRSQKAGCWEEHRLVTPGTGVGATSAQQAMETVQTKTPVFILMVRDSSFSQDKPEFESRLSHLLAMAPWTTQRRRASVSSSVNWANSIYLLYCHVWTHTVCIYVSPCVCEIPCMLYMLNKCLWCSVPAPCIAFPCSCYLLTLTKSFIGAALSKHTCLKVKIYYVTETLKLCKSKNHVHFSLDPQGIKYLAQSGLFRKYLLKEESEAEKKEGRRAGCWEMTTQTIQNSRQKDGNKASLGYWTWWRLVAKNHFLVWMWLIFTPLHLDAIFLSIWQMGMDHILSLLTKTD